MPKAALEALGIPLDAIENILDADRPAIPIETVLRLLSRSNSRCCVCRGTPKHADVVIHHIVDWAESRDHGEENLVVLCLQCHSDAHSVKKLGTNLDSERLRKAKEEWQAIVSKANLDAALASPRGQLSHPVWDYFNHVRLLDCARDAKVSLESLSAYRRVVGEKVVEADGTPRLLSGHAREVRRFMYDGGMSGPSRFVYQFFSDLVVGVLSRVSWVPLEDSWNRRTASGLQPGQFIILRGQHFFRRKQVADPKGPGQVVKVLRKRKGIEISFSLDAWEATSSSAHSNHLCGNNVLTSVLMVRSRTLERGRFVIAATCLAVGWGFGLDRPRRFLRFEAEEEVEEDDYLAPDYGDDGSSL